MFGPGFTLDTLVDTIVKVKPVTITVGTHHYVQLAESDAMDSRDPEDFESVKLLLPTGAAVPSSCEVKLRKKFRGLMVRVLISF